MFYNKYNYAQFKQDQIIISNYNEYKQGFDLSKKQEIKQCIEKEEPLLLTSVELKQVREL